MSTPKQLTIRQGLGTYLQKTSVTRSEIDKFKRNMKILFESVKTKESEENHKNIINKFLTDTYYDQQHYINTAQRKDLVIRNSDKDSPIAVIIEAKSPSNKSQMPSKKGLNCLALQELIWYYFDEKLHPTKPNNELKHLVITNLYEWYIFDAREFNDVFAENKELTKAYREIKNKQRDSNHSNDFYEKIAAPFIEEHENRLNYTYFQIKDYEEAVYNEIADDEKDKQLIDLYKIFSPKHLLKQPFENDSNTLDKNFYAELLHILGLEEQKEGAKKLIKRKAAAARHYGSMLENAIARLESNESLLAVDHIQQYGEKTEEQYFGVGIELLITWVNRILFLKLLEAQLICYHVKEARRAFLHLQTIPNYDALNELFFDVLAKKPQERRADLSRDFANIPYLNSSLFERSLLERQGIQINALRSDKQMPIFANTVLKDQQGKPLKGDMNTLAYLFAFLDAYNFGSDSGQDIQDENKTLINAAVLGLIFEKINGYKDGAFFTPGFITMYMARQTVGRAMVQKFKEVKGWDCENIEQLRRKLDKQDGAEEEANAIINTLRICDPAVGSGHFLVSALNEIIYLKHYLGVLLDRKNELISRREYRISIDNDELAIADDKGNPLTYIPNNPESQRIQEALFHEKQTIIENCLFGVDINPNSVKICRLRLWIELLKHTYYRAANELETLPNIDINIKTGNSLVSRFDLEADLSKALKKNKYSIDAYKVVVQSYRHARSGNEKREVERAIAEIRDNFKKNISPNEHITKKLSQKAGELQELLSQSSLFALSAAELKKREKNREKLEKDIEQLTLEFEELKNNRIYQNSFEWRFEFPEVLDDSGNFVGFDLVIGNPPYMDYREMPAKQADILAHFKTNELSPRPNIYQYFIEQAYNICKPKGIVCYINPAQFLSIDAGYGIRKLLVEQNILLFIDDVSHIKIFDEASTYTVVWAFRKEKNGNYPVQISKCKQLEEIGKQYITVRKNDIIANGKYLIVANLHQLLIQKIEKNAQRLHEIAQLSWGTSQSGYGKKKISKPVFLSLSDTEKLTFAPILQTRDIKRNYIDWKEEYIPRSIFSDSIIKKFNQSEKIVIARMTLRLQAALDDTQAYVGKSTLLHAIPPAYHKKYLLAILNSRLINFWYSNYFENTHLSGGYIRFDVPYLEKIPIVYTKEQMPFINLVENIINAKKSDKNANTIAFEQALDQLVYRLYGLSAEEIAIIEAGG